MDGLSRTRRLETPLRGTVAALLCVLISACGYTAPEVSVISAEATERTPDGLAMVISLDAKNDNEVALPLRTVEYSVQLNGRPVFSGTRSAEATLRRYGTQRFTLPAVVNLTQDPGVLAGPANIRISGSLQYVTPGQLAEVLFDAGVRVPNVAFSGETTVNLDKAKVVVPLPEEPLQSHAPPEPAHPAGPA